MKWISVKDEQPTNGQRILILRKHHAPSIQSALYRDKRFLFAGETLRVVTHWMPLPDPPKE